MCFWSETQGLSGGEQAFSRKGKVVWNCIGESGCAHSGKDRLAESVRLRETRVSAPSHVTASQHGDGRQKPQMHRGGSVWPVVVETIASSF